MYSNITCFKVLEHILTYVLKSALTYLNSKSGLDKLSYRCIENGGSDRMATMTFWSSQMDGGIQSSQLDDMGVKITQLMKVRSLEISQQSEVYKTKNLVLE